MQSALLVIDFQNAIYADPPAYQVHAMQERISGLIGRARAAGLAIVYVQHEQPASPWERGSKTWEFPQAIAPHSGDFVSPKSICDAFSGTALQAHLAQQGIARVFICGYATEFCIDTNVRRAASGMLEVVVLTDAHTTRDRPHLPAAKIVEHHNWVWSEFGAIRMATSDSVDFAAA